MEFRGKHFCRWFSAGINLQVFSLKVSWISFFLKIFFWESLTFEPKALSAWWFIDELWAALLAGWGRSRALRLLAVGIVSRAGPSILLIHQDCHCCHYCWHCIFREDSIVAQEDLCLKCPHGYVANYFKVIFIRDRYHHQIIKSPLFPISNSLPVILVCFFMNSERDRRDICHKQH